jgi:hypothetical protein
MSISRISKVLAMAAALLSAGGMANAAGKLNIITATQDLAAIGAEIGGDKIAIEAIAKGYQDPHFVEPKPSFLLKLKKSDGFHRSLRRAAIRKSSRAAPAIWICRSTARSWRSRRRRSRAPWATYIR